MSAEEEDYSFPPPKRFSLNQVSKCRPSASTPPIRCPIQLWWCSLESTTENVPQYRCKHAGSEAAQRLSAVLESDALRDD